MQDLLNKYKEQYKKTPFFSPNNAHQQDFAESTADWWLKKIIAYGEEVREDLGNKVVCKICGSKIINGNCILSIHHTI